MAKKKSAKKKAPAKKKAVKKAAARKKTAKKKPAAKKKAAKTTATKKKPAATKAATVKKKTATKAATKSATKSAGKSSGSTQKAETAAEKKAARKKGVRRATMTTGIRKSKNEKKIGRSRIPTDAPLSVVFESFPDAQRAFALLGIHTIRQLEEFAPDELVMRLTSPAKQTVGRIRKILAMNNRCLKDDEAFAVEFQERVATRKPTEK